jgi:hypothetical protein
LQHSAYWRQLFGSGSAFAENIGKLSGNSACLILRGSIFLAWIFFGADPQRIRSDVEKGLFFHKLPKFQETIYRFALENKPSVSYAMIRLSALFLIGWLAFIVITIIFGKSCPS